MTSIKTNDQIRLRFSMENMLELWIFEGHFFDPVWSSGGLNDQKQRK